MKTHLLDTQRELQAQTVDSVSNKYSSIIKLLDGIERLNTQSQNAIYKKVIKRIEYKRVMPPEIKKTIRKSSN